MKVAVLGGTRFIGPFLVRNLIERGHEVEVYHRGKTQADLPKMARHVLVDRKARGQVVEALRQSCPDAVIDTCGYVAEDLDEIVQLAPPLKRYVFCSSTAVYGQIGKSTPNELSPVKPTSAYEIGKIACENLLLLAARQEFPITILRLAHPYGPLDELIYSTGGDSLFLDRMRRQKAIVIPSAGDTRMHPIYVADVAEAFAHAMESDDCAGRCFNLAGDKVLSHDEYFGSIARVLGVPLVAEHIPGTWFEQHGELWAGQKRNFTFAGVWHRYESAFDVQSLRATGFRCRTNHDQGVAANVAWLDQHRKIPVSTDNDLEDQVIRAWKSN